MNRFANRAVIVTGGASGGICEAAAKRLFAEGASVVVVDANGLARCASPRAWATPSGLIP